MASTKKKEERWLALRRDLFIEAYLVFVPMYVYRAASSSIFAYSFLSHFHIKYGGRFPYSCLYPIQLEMGMLVVSIIGMKRAICHIIVSRSIYINNNVYAGWLIDWLNEWLNEWLTGWLNDLLTVWLIDWLIDLWSTHSRSRRSKKAKVCTLLYLIDVSISRHYRVAEYIDQLTLTFSSVIQTNRTQKRKRFCRYNRRFVFFLLISSCICLSIYLTALSVESLFFCMNLEYKTIHIYYYLLGIK